MKYSAASTALALFGLSGLSSAAYSLTDNWSASNFFNQFNFFTGDDPTHGFVNYIDQGSAQSQGLINTNNNKIYMGVDYKTVNPGGRGRNSVRLETKKQFTHGLFLLDLNHMPGSVCGSWPAFWTYGPNWPNSGEIDILEGVNSQSTNFVTLHTGGQCKATSGGFSGQLVSTDCSVNTGGTSGCSIHSQNSNTYGNGLNNIGGGVYAMEWLSSGIKVWFFPRNAGIPSDISSGRPNPSGWGTPLASFPKTSCNIDANFANHFVVFDTTFCGDWAGATDVWNNDATCKSKASSCKAYVAGNPSAFQQSYWDINSLKIYQNSGTAAIAGESSSSEINQPVASSQPVMSSQPVASSQPVMSSQPVASSQPVMSSQPVASSQPESSNVPVPSAQPIPTIRTWETSRTWTTSKPVATAQPAPTAAPTRTWGGDGYGYGHGQGDGNGWPYRSNDGDNGDGGRGGRNWWQYRKDHQKRHGHAHRHPDTF